MIDEVPGMDLESFKSLSLLDMVYLRIKDDILSGRYAAGERMIVSRLSEQLGVSHTPINEALNRLVMEGYVEFMPRKGMKVRELDMTEIAETYEIRKMVELYSADKVIARAKADPAFLPEIRRLERMVAEGGYEQAVRDNFQSFFAHEGDFHQYMVKACGNQKLIQMYQNLKANGVFYYKIISDQKLLSEARFSQSIAEHAEIVQAIANGDADVLKSVLAIHLQRSIEYLYATSAMKILERSPGLAKAGTGSPMQGAPQ